MFRVTVCALLFALFFAAISLSGDNDKGITPGNGISAADQPAAYAPDRLIVKFKAENTPDISKNEDGVSLTGYPDIDNLNIKYRCVDLRQLFKRGNEIVDIYDSLGMGNIYVLMFESPCDMDTMVDDYLRTGKFEYAEPDFVGYGHGASPTLIPNDTYFFRQWGLKNDGTFPPAHPGTPDADIDMDEAWDIEQGDPSIVVAILDSGCKLNHVELSGRIWTNGGEIPGNSQDDDGNGYIDDYTGWDFAYDDNQPTDGTGHGTNVTGIVGAIGNNDLGYAGVDWGCKLMICKILDNSGWGYYSWWEDGIYYAVNNGARAINMSVGGTDTSSTLEIAVNYAYSNNVVICASIGNSNNSTLYYPAAYANTIAVGATDTDDTRCNPFFWGGGSNFGDHIDVVAPGNYIYGLYHLDDYDFSWYWGGTSQAAPHVTGLASLLLAQNNSLTVDAIRNIIRNTAEDQVGDPSEDTPGWDQYYGYGRLNSLACVTTVVEYEQTRSKRFTLEGNFPNPFNSLTTIRFALRESSPVKLSIFNLLGQHVAVLIVGMQEAGEHGITWNAGDFPSGVYFARLEAGDESTAIEMVLLK